MGWETGTKREFKFDPNSTENEGRWRLYDPKQIEGKSYFRRKSSTAGVSYVMGKASAGPAEGKSVIQAVRFDKGTFTEAEAAKWWGKNHGRENLVFSDERKKEAGMDRKQRLLDNFLQDIEKSMASHFSNGAVWESLNEIWERIKRQGFYTSKDYQDWIALDREQHKSASDMKTAMNKRAVAAELVKIAKSLAAVSSYSRVIVPILQHIGRTDIDPRHVEAYLRSEPDGHYLDGWPKSKFERLVPEMVETIDADPVMAERLANSYGL